jgi:RNA recognition motif-containing protein
VSLPPNLVQGGRLFHSHRPDEHHDLRRQAVTVYIGNLSYEITQKDLTDVFSEYGTVRRVTLPIDRETGRMRGFAFIEMGAEPEEDAAIEALNGAEWLGRTLKVNKAKPREGGDRRPASHPVDDSLSA